MTNKKRQADEATEVEKFPITAEMAEAAVLECIDLDGAFSVSWAKRAFEAMMATPSGRKLYHLQKSAAKTLPELPSYMR